MTWLAVCTSLGIETLIETGAPVFLQGCDVSERHWLRGVDVSMMWRGPKAAASNGQQQPRRHEKQRFTDGCAVLYPSSTFHKHTCMQD
jgi:hypothetical protein